MEVLRQNGSVHQKMMKYFKSNYCLVDIRLKETLKRITLKQVITNTHSHPPKTYLYPPHPPMENVLPPPICPKCTSTHPNPPRKNVPSPRICLHPPTSKPTQFPAHLFANEEGEKEALEHFKHVIDICLNREHIFQKKLRNT